MVKTVVASFDRYDAAQETVRKLIHDGFMAGDISLLASNVADDYRSDPRIESMSDSADHAATGAMAGSLVGGATGLAASLAGLAIPGIGPILAAGPLLATLGGAGAGALTGGLIGALADVGVAEEHASFYSETVRRGGTLVTVKAAPERAARAVEIMRDNGAIDIDQRVARWRDSGWAGWNPSAPPGTRAEAERERQSYGAHSDPFSGLPPTLDPEGDNRRDSTIRR